MTKFYDTKAPHFQARITVYPLGPGTRKTHPFNGIRWAFAYADDINSDGLPNSVSDVWPEFIDDAGGAIPDEIPIQGDACRKHVYYGVRNDPAPYRAYRSRDQILLYGRQAQMRGRCLHHERRELSARTPRVISPPYAHRTKR